MSLELDFQLQYETRETPQVEPLPVVIVAAGGSTRMGGKNKTRETLLGVPVLARTLLAFERSEQISRIVLVARQDDLLWAQQLLERYSVRKCADLVAGGEDRQASVAIGVGRLGEGETMALVHDGARPLVTEAVIARVAQAVRSNGTAACAVPVKDTIKRADADGIVTETLQRDGLFAMQTPQGFRLDDYRDALAKAGENRYTDDCALLEAAGYPVRLVEGDYHNLKLTTPEDFAVAKAYLEQEESE